MAQDRREPLPPEEQKHTESALFRYRLIAPLLDHPLVRGEIASHLRAVAARSHQIPYSKRTTLNADTIWRWYARYKKLGFEGLKPQPREDAGKSRRIPEEVVQKAIALREELPSRSTPMLIEMLRRDPAVPADLPLKGRTLRQLLQQRGKSRQQLVAQSKAYRRFEREAANVLWQGDMLVGPYLPDVERPGKYRRTALFCFIDDYSRLIPYGEFFFEESLPRLERVLKLALLRRGIPQSLYVDNGKVYVSLQLQAVCATLGIRAIHSTPYTPNTRGKIERFFGTVRSQFLAEVEAAKVATLEELNSSFQAWVERIYHRTVHSETGQSPVERFQSSIAQHPVRQADPIQLRQAFLCMLLGISMYGRLSAWDGVLNGLPAEVAVERSERSATDHRPRGDPLGSLPCRPTASISQAVARKPSHPWSGFQHHRCLCAGGPGLHRLLRADPDKPHASHPRSDRPVRRRSPPAPEPAGCQRPGP